MLKCFAALFFLLLVLSGCHSTSSVPADSFSDAPTQNASMLSDIHFFASLSSGNVNGAKTEDGFFYIGQQSSAYANLQYIDFASKKKLPVCSNPACPHDNEACPSYVPWNGGYPYLAVNSRKIIFIHANAGPVNESIYHEKALPHIEIADLNGANRKTLLSLSANEDIQLGTACNEESLYLIKKRVEGSSSVMDLCEVSLGDGTLETVCRLPDGNSVILGAENQYLVVACCSPASNGNLYSPDQITTYLCFDMSTETCVSQKELLLNAPEHTTQDFVSGTTLYSFSPTDNTFSVYNLTNGQTIRTIPSFFDEEVQLGQIDAVFDNNLLFSEIFAGNEAESTYIRYDLSAETQIPFTLLGAYGTNTGRFFPVVPLCSLKDEYLVVYQCDFSDALIGDSTGHAMDIMKPQFALIAKEDYWAGVPEYRPLDE